MKNTEQTAQQIKDILMIMALDGQLDQMDWNSFPLEKITEILNRKRPNEMVIPSEHNLINRVELASELAHGAAFDEMVFNDQDGSKFGLGGEEDMFVDNGDNTQNYTPEAQEVFDKWYEHYENMIIASTVDENGN